MQINEISSYSIEQTSLTPQIIPAYSPEYPPTVVESKAQNRSAMQYLVFEKAAPSTLRNSSSEEAAIYYDMTANLLEYADQTSVTTEELAEMKKLINQAIALDPVYPGFYLMRANVIVLEGLHQNPSSPTKESWLLAIKDITYSINLNSEFSDQYFSKGEAFLMRGFSYYSLGEEDKFYDDLERAMALDNKWAIELWEVFKRV